MFGVVVLGGLAIVLPRWLSPAGADDAASAVIGAPGDARPTAGLPAGYEGSRSEPEQLLDATARAAPVDAASLSPAERLGLVDYAARELPGRVITADGSALPADLVVYASLRTPEPREARMGGNQGITDEPFREFDLPPAFEDAGYQRRRASDLLAAGTRMEVAADGSFTLQGVPAEGAYVGVAHPWWYAADPPRALPELDAVEVVISRGARIEGRVLDPAGRPLAGAQVGVNSRFNPYDFMQSGMHIVEVEERDTDGEGRFVLSPVPLGASLSVHASRKDRAPAKVELPQLKPGGSFQIDLTLPDGAHLGGRVLDLDDQPVADLTLQIQPASFSVSNISMDKGTWDTKTTSDADGRFGFDGLAAGKYVVRLSTNRYVLASSEAVALDAGERVDDLLLRADPGLAVSGTVVDSAGTPLEAVRVRGSRPPNFMDMSAGMEQGLRNPTFTDAEGRFELRGFEPGDVQISAGLAGYVSHRVTVQAGTDDLSLALTPTSKLSGIALSMTDGEPVPAFTVGLTPKGGMFDMADMLNMEQRFERLIRPRRFAGDTGEFVLEDVVPGEYTLAVTAQGFGNTEVKGIEVLAGQPTVGVIVVMPPECAVTGLVLDAVTGEPLRGVTAATGDAGIMTMISNSIGGGGHSAETGPDGRFRLGGLGTAPFKLSLRENEHADLSLGELQLGYAEVRDLGVLRMSPGAVVYGHVYDERGRGQSGVPVMVAEVLGKSLRNTKTDAEGAYRVQGLVPGSYNVMRMDFAFDMTGDGGANDFMKDMQLESVQLAADEVRKVDLTTTTGGATLSGRVTDHDGTPAPAMVIATPERGGSPRFANTDADGRYEMERIPEGRYTLSAIPMDGAPMGAGSTPASSNVERLRVLGSTALRRDFVLAGGVLRVALVDASGGARLPGVRVILERTDDARPAVPVMERMNWRVAESYSDNQGEVEFRHLPDATYTVVAGGQNLIGMGATGWAVLRRPDVRVVEGQQAFTLQLELRAAGSIHGLVRDRSGRPLGDTAVWARGPDGQWLSTLAEVYTDGSGAFTLGSLADGEWTLALRDTGHALLVREGLRVRAGEQRDETFVLEDGVRVLVDPGDFDPLELDWEVDGPYGRVPTELSTLTSLMHPLTGSGQYDLGRFLPGDYRFTGTQGQQVVYDETLELSSSRDPEVVLLSAP